METVVLNKIVTVFFFENQIYYQIKKTNLIYFNKIQIKGQVQF